VIGVSGITAKEGLTVNGQLDSIPLQIMIEQSRRLIVVADSSKLGQIHYVQIADLRDLDVLVMDRAASPSIRKELAHAGVELVIADFA
jgi:DeoR/GlpR family transcriptional regulator of sugar metabolism